MMIGHVAAGFAGKKFAPKVSLGTLIFAGVFLDILWPIFNLIGIEHTRITPGITKMNPLDLYDIQYSHGLLFSIGWSLLFGIIYFALKKDKRGSVVLGLCVFSHWILDLISHIPDLPVMPGIDVRLGLGLWNSIWGTILVEYGIFVIAVIVYFIITKTKNLRGTIVLVILVAMLTLFYFSSIFGPPPPDTQTVVVFSFFQFVYIALGYWIDRNREVVA